MALFKASETFKGLKEGKTFKKDEPFEMTIKRTEEIKKNIKKEYGIDIDFTRLDVDDKDTEEQE